MPRKKNHNPSVFIPLQALFADATMLVYIAQLLDSNMQNYSKWLPGA
jgi:hypothetical protein